MNLINKLNEIKTKYNFSTLQLAKELNIPQSALWRYEHNIGNPSLATCQKIQKLLKEKYNIDINLGDINDN